MKIKICGITNLEDAQTAVRAGADALGFVFYKKSPRYILPQKAKKIIRRLPKQMLKAGVFVNERKEAVSRIAKLCGLNVLQFHGKESPAFCSAFKNYRVIKAFRVKDKVNLKDVLRYKTYGYLFDAYVKRRPGGTGKKFNWELFAAIRGKIKRPVFLAGGLNENNVKRAIGLLRPDWLDLSSSLEIKPGKKNPAQIKKFMEAINDAY